MIMKMDGNIDRLPVWAQNKIRHQEGTIAALQQRIVELSKGPADSDTFADPYAETIRELGKGVPVRFGQREYNKGHVYDVQLKDDELHVRANGTYREELVILPQVSNAFIVGFRTRS